MKRVDMRRVAEIPVTVNVPGGRFCQGATYKCPLLQESANHPAYFCVVIDDSFWMKSDEILKNPKCPSIFPRLRKVPLDRRAGGALTDQLKNLERADRNKGGL
jgi:hypothetical protein